MMLKLYSHLLPLILVRGLLTSCQSSRPAFLFGFRPAPTVTTPVVPTADALRETARPALTKAAPVATDRRPAVTPSRPRRVAARAQYPGSQPLVAVAEARASRLTRLLPRPQQATARHYQPRKAASAYEGMFYTGLVFVLVGLIVLLTALVTASGMLALAGLGIFLARLVITSFGWAGDGHWDFG